MVTLPPAGFATRSQLSAFAAAIVLACFALASPPLRAHSLPPVYLLGDLASYQSGCFAPCLCPLVAQAPMQGTFRLTPTGNDGEFDTFDVTEVSWTATVGDAEVRITGAGRYRASPGAAGAQRLQLDLAVGDNPLQHFDSGVIPAGDADPPALYVTVSVNGMFCHDTVLVVDAAPIRRAAIRAYRLVEPSLFQQGCIAPCACLLHLQYALRGTFWLVPLADDAQGERFAVADVRFQLAEPGGPGQLEGTPVTGAGTYAIGGAAVLAQRLAVDVAVGAQDAVRLDSGVVAGGSGFPARIDVPIATSTACFQTSIDLHAQQIPFGMTGGDPARKRRSSVSP